MTDDEQHIRDLVERWAVAVHTGDMAGVLTDHAPDIVMFDVPPPEDGVRGLEDYEQTWPGFFAWQASGAVFEIVSLEVPAQVATAEFAHEAAAGPMACDVPDMRGRADGDLAVAWGIDRIVADGAEVRSRATRVFERRAGSWQMIHQHLSFPAQE